MRTFILFLIGLVIGTVAFRAFGEEISYEEYDESDRSLASEQFDRSPAVTPWHVEERNGTPVCVPPPAQPHKKRRKVVKKPVVVTETKTIEKVVEKTVYVDREVMVEAPKNRVRLMGGQGLSSTGVDSNGRVAILSSFYGPVIGIGYDRSLTRRWSVGVEVLSNPTWLINLGYSW
jgi:hypothetical protein